MSQPDEMIEEKPIGRAGYSSEATDEAMRVWTGVTRRTLVASPAYAKGLIPVQLASTAIPWVWTLRVGWESTFWPLALP